MIICPEGLIFFIQLVFYWKEGYKKDNNLDLIPVFFFLKNNEEKKSGP